MSTWASMVRNPLDAAVSPGRAVRFTLKSVGPAEASQLVGLWSTVTSAGMPFAPAVTTAFGGTSSVLMRVSTRRVPPPARSTRSWGVVGPKMNAGIRTGVCRRSSDPWPAGAAAGSVEVATTLIAPFGSRGAAGDTETLMLNGVAGAEPSIVIGAGDTVTPAGPVAARVMRPLERLWRIS